MLHQLSLRRLESAVDHRGCFTEVYSDDWNLAIQPRQFSVVKSHAGTLRGMHVHRRHDEYFLLLNGQAAVGLHDLRDGSPTFGRSQMILLDGAQPTALTFPPGIVHGWYFSSEALHLQAVSEPYASYHHDDNWGCRYDDPELQLQWPATPLRLSERAQSFGSLRALKAALAASAVLA